MNRKLLVFAFLLVLVACREEESSRDPQRVAPNAKAAKASPYTLQIVFRGLAAFAEDKDSGKVWAFLVDADYEKDPRDAKGLPPEASLPPGVLDEIRSGVSFLHRYPSHVARIRLRNADVVSGPKPDYELGLPIDGGDLTFENKLDFAPLPNLCELSDSNKVFAARPELKDDQQERQRIAALDLLDPQLLVANGAIDKRLSARVRIQAGKITAGPVYCPGGRLGYSFKTTALGLECPGEPENAVRLAEEVEVEQRNVIAPTVIKLGPTIDKSITIKPLNPDLPVVVEILNETKEGIKDKLCGLPEQHYEGFRWFYRLLSSQAQVDISSHLFPCEQTGTAGDPKCPVKKMVIPKPGG